ncbi:amino acid adenylation domain-containing protein [Paenibacillus sp. RC21]|uniref:amino acid adenylation domain-containing protein n=1 Tax=Paenibacillus sp. RC21 TaxID=3156312 RepID=UPI00384DA3C0
MYTQWEVYKLSIFKEHELYWEQMLSPEDRMNMLPYSSLNSKEADAGSIPRLHHMSFLLSAQVSERILSMSKGTPMAIYLILLAGVECLIYKYTGEEQIIVGMPALQQQATTELPMNECLPVKTRLSRSSTFRSAFSGLKKTVTEALEHQNLPFRKMVKNLSLTYTPDHTPVFHTVVSLRHLHVESCDERISSDAWFQFEHVENSIQLTLSCNADLYDPAYMNQLVQHLEHILSLILFEPDLHYGSAGLLSSSEAEQWLALFNNTAIEYPEGKTIHQLFREQAERTPYHLAIVMESVQITYRELHERSNRLARTLKSRGVGKEQFIALITDRSIEMVVGILGILKAGGAYVPIDPAYPEQRVKYMLTDSAADMVLIQKHVSVPSDYSGEVVYLDELAAYDENTADLDDTGNTHLAYLIYTSGTTGTPKGVMIEHHSITNTLQWKAQSYAFTEEHRVLMMSNFVFDSFITHLFGPLISGSTIYLLDGQQSADAFAIKEAVGRWKITHLQSTPQFLYRILDMMDVRDVSSLKNVVVGGENITPALIRHLTGLNEQIEICNEYGPTENSVITTMRRMGATDQVISIGKPIANTTVYILNRENQLQPVYAPGELCIKGPGLSRGYLHLPKETAERFTEDPFVPDGRIYRTGDLARWLPDGSIEYLGRIDDQVKIRGYRVEPGEIEEALLSMPFIREAVVVTHVNGEGIPHLCAYVAGSGEFRTSDIRSALSEKIPEYMIPAFIVKLEQMPLTPNGKVDRKALPAPEEQIQRGNEDYMAPRTAVEETLVTIWQAVLGVSPVGIQHHFLDLGGDSIKAIQVSSRLYQAGYKVDVKDLFKYTTIELLSPHVQKVSQTADQGEISGPVMSTPIQRWFLERQTEDSHHFNQSFMLYRKDAFQEEALHATLKELVIHHDALRIVFHEADPGYEAWNRAVGDGELYGLDVFDFREHTDAGEAVERASSRIQSSFQLNKGPLVKAGLFRCMDGDHLLITIHHLVVDGVSWRILLEDLQKAYEQAVKGERIQLPLKTDSFQLWSKQLQEYANSPEIEKERNYWRDISTIPVLPLPTDLDRGVSRVMDSEAVAVRWTATETGQLLKYAHKAYSTEINDLLLTALGIAINKWKGLGKVAVHLEGHGRESMIPGLDITRTVGWFTSQYPVVLQIDAGDELSRQIKQTKEMLRQMTNKGMGYGLLRYLAASNTHDICEIRPDISFNYLGQFDQDMENSSIQLSPYSSGPDMSSLQERPYTLDINGMITGGVLSMGIGFSRKDYRKETMEQLAELMHDSLLDIITHCTQKATSPELTPSDIMLTGITMAELEQLTRDTAETGTIENIYPLTAMQKGMLFHSLAAPDSGSYFEQITFDMQGELDVRVFRESLRQIIDRYDILRTNFYFGWRDTPLQVVYREKEPALHVADIRYMTNEDAKQWTEMYAANDKKRGMDLASDALMRISVFQKDDTIYHVVWSFHHVLMDGWCAPILFNELLEIYYAKLHHTQLELPPTAPYSEYITWLERQDRAKASLYWKQYLEYYEGQAILPGADTSIHQEYELAETAIELSTALTNSLKQLAKENHVTLNTLLQTVWGIVLHKYNGARDTVFGSVVSGRPAEIPGIERMIGLFINTIPVRIRWEEGEVFTQLLQRNQQQAVASGAFDTYPLYEIQSQLVQKQLITHIMIFENYPVEQQLEDSGLPSAGRLDILHAEVQEQTNYNFNIIVVPGEKISIRFNYNARVFLAENVKRIGEHVHHLLQQIVGKPDSKLAELQLLTVEETRQTLEQCYQAAGPECTEKTIHQLFEEQAERYPDHIALVHGDVQLTYRELNEQADRLAQKLIAYGVEPERIVCLMADRSPDMIIGMIAILKAGGAYMPVDPTYPQERIRYMLEDSGVDILLLQSHLQEKVAAFFSGTFIVFNDETCPLNDQKEKLSRQTKPRLAHSDSLACVIYTSGTTGKPKGILTTHRNIIRVVYESNYITIEPEDRILQLSNYAFDGSTFDIYSALLNGAGLVLISKEALLDMDKLTKHMAAHNVSVMFVTTALFNVMFDAYPDRLVSLRKILFGGERVSVDHVRKALSYLGPDRLIHVYGPTESTVFATAYHVNDITEHKAIIPIGYPVSHTSTYIVNEAGQLQPPGVPGELWVGGSGLARGYLNRPELTSEKFIPNPFSHGERVYRTGDWVKWLPDGAIEYLGRIDHQVKIRGHRVELGEIETRLLSIEQIQETIVIAREQEGGTKQLCAYYTGSSTLTPERVRTILKQDMPAYMIPAFIIKLPAMPLTLNGKIDRNALPAPENSVKTPGNGYAAPRTEIESLLVEIWQQILGVPQVGIHDDFFDLGGDSIQSIQVSSRLSQAGFQLEMRHWYTSQTIAELSVHVEQVNDKVDQGPVSGTVRLTPIQRWFLESPDSVNPHHFNQSMLFAGVDRLDLEAIHRVMRRIAEHHDGLRTVFRRSGEQYIPYIRQVDEGELYTLEVRDCIQLTNPATAIEEASNRVQSSIQLDIGPLVKLVLFRCNPSDHLLIVVHHLVMDMVSWRILLEDITSGYEQAVNGQVITFPPKTGSFQNWAEALHAYAYQPQLQHERAYWQEVASQGSQPIPKDYTEQTSLVKDTVTITIEWSNEETRQLLTQVHQAYDTDIQDLLLAAWSQALYQWKNLYQTIIHLEGHGREAIIPGIDITRTVGWFTSQYPVRLVADANDDISQHILKTKDHLRQIPNKGIGFGILRYISDWAQEFKDAIQPEVSFNYLGQFDQELQYSAIGISPYSKGNDVSEMQQRRYVLDIVGSITSGKLTLAISYSTKQFQNVSIQRLGDLMKDNLRTIIKHCVRQGDNLRIPSSEDIKYTGYMEKPNEFADRLLHSPWMDGVTGAVLVLVQDNKIVVNQGCGYTDLTRSTKVDPATTLMRVGSINKIFTSVVIRQLAEQGKLDINAKVRSLIEDIDIPGPFNESLTLKHLLNYESGLDHPDSGMDDLIRGEVPLTMTLKQFIHKYMPAVVHIPGEQYQYSNFAYIILGYIIEQITGMSCGQYAHSHILQPLGMNSSSFTLPAEWSNRLAKGYHPDQQLVPAYLYSPIDTATGSMVSTGDDMARFMLAMLGEGAYGGSRILSRESAQALMSVKPDIEAGKPYGRNGFEMNIHPEYGSERILVKSGNFPGFSALMWLLPDQKTGAFLMCNQSIVNKFELFEAFANYFCSSASNRKKLYV